MTEDSDSQVESYRITIEDETGRVSNGVAAKVRSVVENALRRWNVPKAELEYRFVDDATIWDINRRFLGHDYPTDVISFPLDDGDRLEGSIVISVDTAGKQAEEFDTSVETELLLYVAHGTLHLVGFDDAEGEERSRMRQAEREILRTVGIELPESHDQT
ncbi:hypothetical protein JCM19992_27550 [Thermostilla marina]